VDPLPQRVLRGRRRNLSSPGYLEDSRHRSSSLALTPIGLGTSPAFLDEQGGRAIDRKKQTSAGEGVLERRGQLNGADS
jgi:hypothetical protein